MDKKKKRGLIIAIGIVALIIAALTLPVYFASQFSATYPPIKDYEYPMTTEQLERAIIDAMKTDSCFKYNLTDTAGTKDNRNYYMTIEHKSQNNSLTFYINYSNIDNAHCRLGLIGIFDHTKKTGGYKFGDKGVEELVFTFERQLADKLK